MRSQKRSSKQRRRDRWTQRSDNQAEWGAAHPCRTYRQEAPSWYTNMLALWSNDSTKSEKEDRTNHPKKDRQILRIVNREVAKDISSSVIYGKNIINMDKLGPSEIKTTWTGPSRVPETNNHIFHKLRENWFTCRWLYHNILTMNISRFYGLDDQAFAVTTTLILFA